MPERYQWKSSGPCPCALCVRNKAFADALDRGDNEAAWAAYDSLFDAYGAVEMELADARRQVAAITEQTAALATLQASEEA